MKYQISYYGRQGCAEKTADYIFEKLPKDTLVIDANEDVEVCAETIIAIFEMGSNFDTVPYKIIDIMERTKERELILLPVVPVKINEKLKNKIERAALPFIPDECDYLGIHLVYGEADKKLVHGIEKILEADSDNFGAEAWLEECDKSKGHPNMEDLEKAWLFIEKCAEEVEY
ncbi:MAG: hypothetical protein IJ306_07995 [Oscillospiraceae bacterium]|nr:hypothetical protein [Oscillospiraceae bacterium]